MAGAVWALGVTQILGYGTLFYAFPLLVPALAAEFGRSEPAVFAVFSVALLVGGLSAPIAGRLIDRRGAPRVMAAGSLGAAVLLAATAAAPGFWSFAALTVLTQIAAVSLQYDAAFAALALLAGREARRATTRLTLIAGFASTLFWPLTGLIVEAQGWRAACLIFAALHLTLGFGLHRWLCRLPPAETGAPPVPGARREAEPLPAGRAQVAYATVAGSFALSAALIAAFSVHMVPLLAATGLGAAATAAAMLVGPAQVGARLVDALFWKGLHPLSVAAISSAALPAAALILLFAPLPDLAAGAAFAVLFGVGQGLASIVRGAVPLALFGPLGYGGRLGSLALIRTLASAGAPFAFALALVRLGEAAALGLAAALGIAAMLPLVWLRARLAADGLLAPLR